MSNSTSAGRIVVPTVLLFSLLIIRSGATLAKEQISPAALKDFRAAVSLLRSRNGKDKGIKALQSVIEKHPGDIIAKRGRELLRENGVGEKIRVDLIDSQVFNKRFGYSEKFVLELGEKVLGELRKHFEGITPFFQHDKLYLVFYDSQARYRRMTGRIRYSGHFSIRKSSDEYRTLDGEVIWYFPMRIGSSKDRLTRVKSLLYHETMHFLNSVHFRRALPSIIDEGLAVFYESRHNTDYYQVYRGNVQEYVESNSRNGLNLISKYSDFEKFLGAPRGFGKSDQTLDRWYGLSYAVIDFFERGEITSRRASTEKLFKALHETIQRRPYSRWTSNDLLTKFAREFYGADLETFYRALIGHITKNYRQQ